MPEFETGLFFFFIVCLSWLLFSRQADNIAHALICSVGRTGKEKKKDRKEKVEGLFSILFLFCFGLVLFELE